MSPVSDGAKENIPLMSVTLDTSHLEMSPLNSLAPGTGLDFESTNNQLMSVTAETSHDAIGPYRPWEQSVGESLRHLAMASSRSSLDCGGHSVVVYCYRVQKGGVGFKVRVWVRVRVMFSVCGLGRKSD